MLSILTIAWMLLLGATVVASGEKIDGRIDVALVIPPSKEQADMDELKKVVEALPDHFVIDQQKARVAVLYIHPPDIVLLNLTGNKKEFEDFLNNRWPTPTPLGSDNRYEKAYKALLDQVFDFVNNKHIKVVIVLMNSFPLLQDASAWAAIELRQKGTLVYVIYDKDKRYGSHGLERLARQQGGDKIIGVSQRAFFSESIEALWQVQASLPVEMCGWVSSCLFADANRIQCNSEVWKRSGWSSPFSPNQSVQCDALKPPERICANGDCEQECDNRWLWPLNVPDNKRCTRDYCGKTFRRLGPMPEKMDHCLPEIKCSPCPN